MTTPNIRSAQLADRDQLAEMRHALWPDSTAEEHARETETMLAGNAPGLLPSTVLVAESDDGALVGFIEVGLRSHVDGCDYHRPVGYVEGWFVAAQNRGQKIGAALMRAAEDWARAQGCVEMGSDTWQDNEPSQRAHVALGYEIVDRVVNFRKSL